MKVLRKSIEMSENMDKWVEKLHEEVTEGTELLKRSDRFLAGWIATAGSLGLILRFDTEARFSREEYNKTMEVLRKATEEAPDYHKEHCNQGLTRLETLAEKYFTSKLLVA